MWETNNLYRNTYFIWAAELLYFWVISDVTSTVSKHWACTTGSHWTCYNLSPACSTYSLAIPYS